MAYWLCKTEADAYSIQDLRRDGTTGWDGIRNYLARIHLRAMRPGDLVVVYHSNADPSGAAGIAEVTATAHPDPTQFDPTDSHFDAKSDPAAPRWDQVTLRFVEEFPAVVPLATLRDDAKLTGLMLTSGKAMRLSVQPLDAAHFNRIRALGRTAGPASKTPPERRASKPVVPKRAPPARKAVRRAPAKAKPVRRKAA